MPTQAFDNVYVGPRVRVALQSLLDTQHARKFWDLVNKLRNGNFDTPGMRVERLRTRTGKVYSARLNIEMRVIFSMYTDREHKKRSLVFWDANHHDDAYNRIERTVVPSVFQPTSNFLEPEQIWSESDHNLDQLEEEAPDSEDITNGLLLFRVPYFVLSQPEKYRQFEKSIDRYLRLSEEQEDLLGSTDRAYLVRGAAGTGKTSLALFHALNLHEQFPNDNVYFFTYNDELACVCRCYKSNLVETGDIHVFSYVQFCKHFLRQHPEVSKVGWQWIDREKSIKHLREIISGRARWARTIDPELVYSYMYSLLKGRLVPGSDRLPTSPEDFRRIFKEYGSAPANLDDILDIFSHYEERLARSKQKDEADLIRYCYETFKKNAVLSADKEQLTWLVIDEIQDFTELEWKSILLFWENQIRQSSGRMTYPFLCGDRNQNISRSGFRWQQVDSYVENVLRDMHRSSAVHKIQLHRNFRNTKEIFDLGLFIHSLSTEARGDTGLPPEGNGNVAKLVVGSEDEFKQFLSLLKDPSDEQLPSPMVILLESDDQFQTFIDRMTEDDGLFFMSSAKSKGLEFEDVIAYRLFSSLHNVDLESVSDEEKQRLVDLWYMTIMRARQNLLIYVTPQDLALLQKFLGEKHQQFLNLVELHESAPQSQLLNFYHQRERYLPNYSVIFLERTKANEIWQNRKDSEQATETAFALWNRCRDHESIGRAYVELGEYQEAIPHLQRACLYGEAAACYEKMGRHATAAELYEQDGMFKDAGRCFEKSKQFARAAQAFETIEEWLQAATNYYLAGNNAQAAVCFERANMWQSAADLYKLKANWGKAAELYQKCDQFELAGDMYLQLKDKLDAARCYSRAGVHEKAGQLFEALMRWSEAAEAYEEVCNWEKAGSLYSKAGRIKDAARCKEKSGDLNSAAAEYERIRSWNRAAQAYLNLNQTTKAAECFERDNNWEEALKIWNAQSDWTRAAKCLDKMGKIREAAECFAKAGMHNEAGHCYERIESFAEAADQYLKANGYAPAASMLVRLNRRLDAARLFLLAGQPQVAIEVLAPNKAHKQSKDGSIQELVAWVEDVNRSDLASQLYEALGEYDLAIEHYRKSAKLDKAADCAELAGQFEFAGELHMQAGLFEKAAANFKQAGQIKRAAMCYEMLKRWTDARALYEQINDLEGVQRCATAANWL